MVTKVNVNGNFQYARCFAAQYPILTGQGMDALRHTSIFIAGAGGLGSLVAIMAARSGFEKIYQADPQLVEADNLNRIFANPQFLGRSKLFAIEEFLVCFDRLQLDPDFIYTPLPFPVEDQRVRPYLEEADCIFSCANSPSARLFLARYAVEQRKTLLNVGFACQPGNFMNGEVSIYRSFRTDLACPGCISLGSEALAERPSDPLFAPPLGVIGNLAVHLLAAEITNFDGLGNARPNYFLYDGFWHSLSAHSVAADPDCKICQSETVHERGAEQ